MIRKKLFHRIQAFVLIPLGLFLSGFDISSPDKWGREIAKLWERNHPCVKNVTFWDFETEQYRGVRVFLYTIPQERINRLIDRRLHEKMFEFLAYICQNAITLDAFDQSPEALIIEKRLGQLVDEWKLRGKINPAVFFEPIDPASGDFPPIDADVLVFIERIHYDQGWKEEKKSLVIGINAVAFEMDYGAPLYQDRILVEAPWHGENDTAARAEHVALLRVADNLGLALQKKAEEINQEHLRLDKERLIATMQQQTNQKNTILNETRDLRTLYDSAQKRLKMEPAPADLISSLTETLTDLKPLLDKKPPQVTNGKGNQPLKEPPKNQLTAQDLETRRQLAQAIRDDLQTWDAWKLQQIEELKKQQDLANHPPLRMPGKNGTAAQPASPENLPAQTQTPSLIGLPKPDSKKNNLFDRAWLRPSSAAIQSGTIPLMQTNGSLEREKIPSTKLPDTTPNSFKPFENTNTPPPPDSSKTAQKENPTEAKK